MEMTKEVLVIGGGVIGCAITYYLAKQGVEVGLIERNTVGSGSTSLAASLLTKARSNPAIIPLVQESYRAMTELNDRLEHPLKVHQVGSLHLAASASTVDALNNLKRIADEFNIENQDIEIDGLIMMVPWLNTEEILEATFMPEDCFTDAYVLANGYLEMAKRLGATIHQNTDVKALILQDACVAGVSTSKGVMHATHTIDAAGAWANLISLQAGVHLPMAPIRSNYWITTQNPQLFSPNQPIVILPDASAYTRPESGALLFGLRESNSVHFDPRNLPEDLTGYVFGDPEDRWNILIRQGDKLQRFFPEFANIEIPQYIAGLSTYTPDGMPVLGGLPGLKGFLAATGCSGAGVAISGGIGRIMFELITGITPYCDIDPFRPNRFGKVDALCKDFRQRCADARSNKKSG